jgi:hypothetical protein
MGPMMVDLHCLCSQKVLEDKLPFGHHRDVPGSHIIYLRHTKIFDLTMNRGITKSPQYNIGFIILVCG